METVERYINGRRTQVAVADDPEDCLPTSIGDVQTTYQLIEDKYNGDMDGYFLCTYNSPDLTEKAANWIDSQLRMIRLAHVILRSDPESDEIKTLAMEKMDRVIRDARLLVHGLECYLKRLNNKGCTDLKLIKTVDRLSRKCMDHWLRADSTRNLLERKLHGGASKGVRNEKMDNVNKKRKNWVKHVPAGHIYLPPRPYPPLRIPPDEPVPMYPKVYLDFLGIPPEELAYDEENDEFVIPEGYVSEDGSLDHNSIRWDYEKREVTFQYVDGIPVTWKFWKAENLRDFPRGWADEYQIRMYAQLLAQARHDPYGPQTLDEKKLPYNKKFQ